MGETMGDYVRSFYSMPKGPCIKLDEEAKDYWVKPEYYSVTTKFDGYGDAREFLAAFEDGVFILPKANEEGVHLKN